MNFFFWRHKRRAEEFDLEEAMMDQSGKNFEVLELPLHDRIFRVVTACAVILGVVIAGRVAHLGIVKGSFYNFRAVTNVNKETVVPAPRGIIFDRFGVPLVENRSTFDVYIRAADFLKNRGKITEELRQVLNLSEGKVDDLLYDTDLEKSDLVLVARDVESEEVIALQKNGTEGISVEDAYRRTYPLGPDFAHIVGYVDSERDKKTGLEAYYDGVLKGEDGAVVKSRNAQGEVIDEYLLKEAVSGQPLTTTIDADLQKELSDRLRGMLNRIDRFAGVGIAVDPRNGEILALVSLPSFDNNLFAAKGGNEEKKRILASNRKPLFNRAISGLYSPGSTVKPMVAIAALAEGVVDTEKSILSIGYIEIPNPYNPEHPSRFLDWKAHGWVNMYSALARSSDVYFYAIGGGFEDQRGLGIQRLHEWWAKFGFGERHGIDLPNEQSGFLPGAEEKQKRTGQIWRIGDTYNVSIGQGDLLVTPLELIDAIAAIANGGKIYTPFLNKEKEPEVLIDLSSLKGEIEEAQRGMEDAVSKPYGTANLLSGLPFASAGKTGSAQIQNNTKTNAFFVGYMPAENPELALLVLVEDAKEGSLNAVPVARDVFSWYYENRIQHRPAAEEGVKAE